LNDIDGQILDQNTKLKNAVFQINDARQYGVEGAEELDRQKNVLMGTKDRLRNMDADLGTANNLMTAMKMKIIQNRAVFKLSCWLFVIIVGALCVLKWAI
jgi:hypothetical protein